MRLRVLSDLHLEHFDGHRELPPAEADVVVLAGDIQQEHLIIAQFQPVEQGTQKSGVA